MEVTAARDEAATLASLYVEPESAGRAAGVAGAALRRRVQDLPLRRRRRLASRRSPCAASSSRSPQGELVAVIGPSGCGKSTFLHLAAGLDEPSAGDVSAFGTSLSRLDEAGLAAYRARKTAVIFQSENLWPGLTAQENVETMLRLAGVKEPGRIAAEALGAFGLGERLQHRVTALSGGEQQRVAVAGAAARRADLVLADEPTGELDEANEALVLDALRALREQYGATVVVVSHSPRVADFADRVIELRDGKVVTS